MTCILYRFDYRDSCTLGVLDAFGERFLTLELPWRENRRNRSCIPEGVYPIRQKGSEEKINVFGVPNRSAIQMHIANQAKELQGCIAVGCSIDSRPENEYLGYSTRAIRRLCEQLLGVQSTLIVTNIYRGL